MAVHPQGSTWTDERLDDLSQSVRDGFARNEAGHRDMREEMRAGFAKNDLEHAAMRREMREGFDRNDLRFDQLASRIESLQLTLIVGMIGLIGAIIASSIFG